MHGVSKSKSLIAAACLGLAGCGSGLSSVSPVKASTADFEQYRSASRDGVVHTVVVGGIANADDADVKEAVNRAFSVSHVGPPAVFSSAPDSVDIRNPRIIVLFSPRRSFGPSQVCNDDDELPAALVEPEDGRIRAIAAFCVGAELKTWTVLNSPAPTSTEDPVLYQIAQRMALDVIPNRSSKAPGDCLSNC